PDYRPSPPRGRWFELALATGHCVSVDAGIDHDHALRRCAHPLELAGFSGPRAGARGSDRLFPPIEPGQTTRRRRHSARGEGAPEVSNPQDTLRRAQETIRQLYGELERTNQEVMALTLELEQRVDALRKEVTERKRAESERQAQVERLKLLNQITHAIGERQDLRSIFQVTVRSLEEHLPLDLACACVSEPTEAAMTIMSASYHDSRNCAQLQIDTSALSSYLHGEIACEPDAESNSDPLAQQLAKAGLRSFIVARLRAGDKVFGALVAARHGGDSFSADERE